MNNYTVFADNYNVKMEVIMKFKKLITTICIASTLLSAVCFVGCFNKKNNNQQQENKQEQTNAVVRLDFNPSIQLLLDKENNVLSAVGKNEDGQVLLYEEDGIIGQSINQAINNIIRVGKNLGYLNSENNFMNTMVLTNDSSTDNQLISKVNASVKWGADSAGISIKTHSNGTYSLQRKLKQIKMQYPDNETLKDMSLTQFNWVYTVTESGDISFDGAITLSREKLIKTITDAHQQGQEMTSKMFNRAREGALSVYNIAEGALVDGRYSSFYMSAENMQNHPTTFWYGSAYQAYKSMARSFNGTANAIKQIEDLSVCKLTEEQALEVVSVLELGEENVDLIKNNDGSITISSVESYADKKFNSIESEKDLKEKKAQLEKVLSNIEQEMMTGRKELIKERHPQIANAVAFAKKRVEQIPNEQNNQMIEMFKKDFNDAVKEIEKMLEGEQTSYREMQNLSKMMDEKAQEMQEKIEKDLSKEELTAIENQTKGAEERLQTLKSVLEKRINKSEEMSKTRLKEIKENRIKQIERA